MLTLDTTILQQVITAARAAAAGDSRWLNAIDRAAVELVENPFIEWQNDHLLIGSASGQVYASNGVCQCKAYEFGRPCWHRASARLYQRYQEAAQAQATAAARSARLAQIEEEVNDWY